MENQPEPEFRGVTIQRGSKLRLVNLSINTTTGQGSVDFLVQWDMYPAWVDIARLERDRALAARETNPGPDGETAFGEALYAELAHSMTSLCAAAFAFEAFSNSVRIHREMSVPIREGQSSAARVQHTLHSAFRIPNNLGKGMRATLGQMFEMRNRAVHPPVGFVEPARHPAFPVAMEPSYVRFRSENAVVAVQFLNDLLPYLLARPRPGTEEWIGWCKSAGERLAEPTTLSE